MSTMLATPRRRSTEPISAGAGQPRATRSRLPATSAEALQQGAQPAPRCRCEQSLPDAWHTCIRCGRIVEVAP
jgi:hypothetical protein